MNVGELARFSIFGAESFLGGGWVGVFFGGSSLAALTTFTPSEIVILILEGGGEGVAFFSGVGGMYLSTPFLFSEEG